MHVSRREQYEVCVRVCALKDGGHDDDVTIVRLRSSCCRCHHITVVCARACMPRVG
jgi:hypothetical protein